MQTLPLMDLPWCCPDCRRYRWDCECKKKKEAAPENQGELFSLTSKDNLTRS